MRNATCTCWTTGSETDKVAQKMLSECSMYEFTSPDVVQSLGDSEVIAEVTRENRVQVSLGSYRETCGPV